jgi:hypothetical protein
MIEVAVDGHGLGSWPGISIIGSPRGALMTAGDGLITAGRVAL